MTLGMLKNVLGESERDLLFTEDSRVEIINGNTCAHYHKNDNGEMTLGGEVIEVTEDWVLGLPVTHISVCGLYLIVMVDG